MSIHKTVLSKETIRIFKERLESQSKYPIYVDGTLGGGGHARALAQAFGNKLDIVAFDLDQRALEESGKTLKDKCRNLILINRSFRDIDKVLQENSIDKVDMILFDLGLSSDELDNCGKGFSFMSDEPLLMTLGNPKDYPFTAYDVVNDWKEEDIANVIYAYGEERFARRISRNIVNYRLKKKIETASELAEIVRFSIPQMVRRKMKINPATKTFQALRIIVNDELGTLRDGLRKGFDCLNKGGIMQVISFHSLEDRIVKNFIKEEKCEAITKKPIVPEEKEILENPRARSAKLRALKKKEYKNDQSNRKSIQPFIRI